MAICITAVICFSIVAFPFYYQTFGAEEEEPAPTVITEEAAATSRYTSLGEFDTRSKIVIDQETGKLYRVARGANLSYDITYVGKIG